MKHFNQKMNVLDKTGFSKLRIYHKKQKGIKASRYLIKCGCCESSVEIYYDDDGIEINGVHASLEEWKRLLFPLLEKKKRKETEKQG